MDDIDTENIKIYIGNIDFEPKHIYLYIMTPWTVNLRY